ncbi:sulfur carrier protein ThiS [Rhodococcus triatomae]|uniref:Sulfur carrier protein n=1 Tax=Rhodococcus triatomae TaxID=300028 RepID=A0A1G8NEC9_9NOCA|nr:sulfur carrier protein ThiS [Rhodococcus triatomae]QNG19982.1 sulfur carrier protein ThiS [Rhodococcus triatomae]QNG24103.1 sulfur carrier protein ThiS [Rhodococcus triatomae]SDI78523.1 sulfur carrier protein [Rhodococcus triatomae]
MSEPQTAVPIGVTVNGEDHEFPVPVTMSQLLEQLSLPTKGIAVAVDGAVFPRTRWDEPVRRGSEIEILTAVQGG